MSTATGAVVLKTPTASAVFATPVATIVGIPPAMVAATPVLMFAMITGMRPMRVFRSWVIRCFTNRQPNLTVISDSQHFDRHLITNG